MAAKTNNFVVIIEGREHVVSVGKRSTLVDGKNHGYAMDTAARMLLGNIEKKIK